MRVKNPGTEAQEVLPGGFLVVPGRSGEIDVEISWGVERWAQMKKGGVHASTIIVRGVLKWGYPLKSSQIGVYAIGEAPHQTKLMVQTFAHAL